MPRKPRYPEPPRVIVIGPESELSQDLFFKHKSFTSIGVTISRWASSPSRRFRVLIDQDMVTRGMEFFPTLRGAAKWAGERVQEIVEERT